MKIIDLVQGSPEWLAYRIGKGTASNAAAVIGQDPYKTPYRLWCEMTMRVPAFEGNKYTDAGKEMEPKARSIYEIEHGFVEMPPTCVEHEQYPELMASLDGLSADYKTILELKYPSEKSHGLAMDGKVPDHYIPQIQHQFACAKEAEVAHYCSFRDDKLVKVVVERDPVMIVLIEQAWLAFLELVKTDCPPALTPDDVKIIEGHEEISRITAEIKRAKDIMSKHDLDEMKATLIKLADHPKMKCNGVQVSTVMRNGKFSFYKLTITEGA